MWKQFWNEWTLDKPAAFGDLLWEIFVVQLAAVLDRLTLRQIIALIPAVILVVAYAHSIPLPPELMLVGDGLAYIDIFSVILLLGIVGRATALWFFARQAAGHAVALASKVLNGVRRFDVRRRREAGARNRKCPACRTKIDDEYPAIEDVAWA